MSREGEIGYLTYTSGFTPFSQLLYMYVNKSIGQYVCNIHRTCYKDDQRGT